MALLFLFHKIRRKLGLKITVAHVSHGLQPKADRRAAALVRSYCRQLKVPCRVLKANVRAAAKKSGRSLEEQARIERYRVYESAALRARATVIATAHTRDDQAETVLLRILRGSGLKGLSGIPVRRSHGRLRVVRPLLFAEKNELLTLLREEGVPFVVDATNRRAEFTRNRVRHALLPMLERRFNPNIRSTLMSLQRTASDAHDLISGLAREALGRARDRGGRGYLIERLRRCHPAVLSEALRLAFAEAAGEFRHLSFENLRALCDLVRARAEVSSLHLPQRIQAVKKGRSLRFIRLHK